MIYLLIVAISLYWRWFFTTGIFTWGDWGFYLPHTAQQFFTLPSIWNDAFLGFVEIGLSLYPISKLFYGLLSFWFPSTIVDRFIYFYPSIILSVFGSYLLLKYIQKNKLGAIVGSLLYSFNAYFLLIRTGHLTLATSFALAPLGLLLFIRSLDCKSLRLVIFSGLVSAISSLYEVRAFYLIAWVYGVYALYYFLTHKRSLIQVISYLALIGGIVLLLNFYWIFALSSSGGVFNANIFHRPLFGTREMNLLKSLTLFHPPDPNQSVPWFYWFLPAAAFTGLYVGRKNRFVPFFATIALMGIFFVKLTGEPFGQLYPWLYQHFPGFNMFRESSKFFFFTALGFSGLVAALIGRMKSSFYIKILSLAAVVVIVYPFPQVFSGTIGKLFTPRHVPASYLYINQFIASQPEFFRTLYIPQDSRWAEWDHLHPKLSARSLVNQDWYLLNNYTSTGLDYSEFANITSIFSKPWSDQLLDMSGVKYVVVPPQDFANEDNFYEEYTRDQFITFLDTLPYLAKSDKSLPDMTIYENQGYYSLFNAAYTFHNPSLYTVSSPPSVLDFSQNYHPGWVAKDATGQIYSAVPTTYNLMQFHLPENLPSIEVVFRPQKNLDIGLIVSLLSAVLILLSLRYVKN